MIISGIWVICSELIRLKFDKFDGLSRFSGNLRLWTDIWTLINWKQKAGVAIDFCAWYPEFSTGQIESVLQLSHSSTSRVTARRFSQHTISGKSSANVKLNRSSREYHKNRPTPPQASRSFTINRNEYIHDCVSSTELATTTRFSLAEFFLLFLDCTAFNRWIFYDKLWFCWTNFAIELMADTWFTSLGAQRGRNVRV